MISIADYFHSCVRALRRAHSRIAPIGTATLVGFMILSYLAATIGYPDFRPTVIKDTSEPFPCQHRACGCRTAEQCRTSCCCGPKTAVIVNVAVQESVLKSKNCCSKSIEKPASKPAITKHGVNDNEQAPVRLKFVLGIEAQKCHGGGVDWIQAGFVSLPPQATVLSFALPTSDAECFDSQSYLSPVLGHGERPG
jgi:hypothetical protein